MNSGKQDYEAHRTRDPVSRVNYLRGNYKKIERFLRYEDGSFLND